MAANGISTLATKRARQDAKLTQANADRAGEVSLRFRSISVIAPGKEAHDFRAGNQITEPKILVSQSVGSRFCNHRFPCL